ncbi:hypothetical protein NFI96_030575 [Prochilodus magdalenae]|nr:hypothetical protein NFI96_030575 [Prochilodus magdalenae]
MENREEQPTTPGSSGGHALVRACIAVSGTGSLVFTDDRYMAIVSSSFWRTGVWGLPQSPRPTSTLSPRMFLNERSRCAGGRWFSTEGSQSEAMADGLCLLVNRVVEALSKEECRTLLYLCSDLLSTDCVEDCRGALITLTNQSPPGDAFLKEVLFRLRRFDLLKRLLRTTRKDVEEMLKANGRVVSDYRVLMTDLSESLAADELKSLTFLLSTTMPKGPLERATVGQCGVRSLAQGLLLVYSYPDWDSNPSLPHVVVGPWRVVVGPWRVVVLSAESFLDVVTELEKMDKVSRENLEVVEQCLKNISRVDLAKRVQAYQRGQGGAQPAVSPRPAAARNGTTYQGGPQTPGRREQRLAEGFERLKLSVPETGAQHSQVLVDQYYINHEARGVCVIIDCIGNDGDVLKETFGHLGFQVHLHGLLAATQVVSVLKSVSQQAELQQASTFSCCLLSRGSGTHLLGTDTCGPGLALSDLRQIFGPVHCPLLLGKPKLFFTQIYVEDAPTLQQNDPNLETDGVPSCVVANQTPARATLPASADVLWSECHTLAWQLEKRDHRSVYLKALSAALLRARERKLNILEAFLEVNRDVYEHNRRNPDTAYHVMLSHTLRKSLYL